MRVIRGFMYVVLLVSIAGCGKIALESQWRTPDVIVDGVGAEWEGSLRHLGSSDIAVGVYNDDEAIYVGVVPWNLETQAQVTANGCVLRFGAIRKEDDKFGLCITFGDAAAATRILRNASRTETIELIHELSEHVTGIEVLDDFGKSIAHESCEEAEKQGVEFAVGEYNGHLLVEARIPYRFALDGKELQINDDPALPLELTLETPKVKNRDRKNNGLEPPSGLTGTSDLVEENYIQPSSSLNTQLQVELAVTLATSPDLTQ